VLPPAILAVALTDLVSPPAILAVAPTDVEVGVLELALANTTLLNLVSNSFKGIIHDKESRKLHKTQLVTRADALLRRLPSVTIASISKKKKSVTVESEHPTPTASAPTISVSLSGPIVRVENNREGLRGRINPPIFLSPVLRGKSHSSRRNNSQN
jgi:hypothetical protein